MCQFLRRNQNKIFSLWLLCDKRYNQKTLESKVDSLLRTCFAAEWGCTSPRLLVVSSRSPEGCWLPSCSGWSYAAPSELKHHEHSSQQNYNCICLITSTKQDCWHTCPSLHWYRCVQIPTPRRHGDDVPPSRGEHIERALSHVRLHLARVHDSVTWKMSAIIQKPSKLKNIHLSPTGIWRYHGEWWGSSRHVTQKGRGSTWRWATSHPSGECGDLPPQRELQASFTHIS